MFCVKCGNKAGHSVNFCVKCGERMRQKNLEQTKTSSDKTLKATAKAGKSFSVAGLASELFWLIIDD